MFPKLNARGANSYWKQQTSKPEQAEILHAVGETRLLVVLRDAAVAIAEHDRVALGNVAILLEGGVLVRGTPLPPVVGA